jgi:hypothetical protein
MTPPRPQGQELLTHHLEAATSEYAAIFQLPASGGALEPFPPVMYGSSGAENAPPTAAAGTCLEHGVHRRAPCISRQDLWPLRQLCPHRVTPMACGGIPHGAPARGAGQHGFVPLAVY